MKQKYLALCSMAVGTMFILGVGGCIQNILFGVAPLLL